MGIIANKRGQQKGEPVGDPVGRLAAEILAKAVDDWRMLIECKAWLPNVEVNPRCNFTELRNFFSSDWCDLLTIKFTLQPADMLKILEAELQEAMQKYEGENQ